MFIGSIFSTQIWFHKEKSDGLELYYPIFMGRDVSRLIYAYFASVYDIILKSEDN